MRPIKFRAWDKENNKYFYFDFTTLNGWDDGGVYLDDTLETDIRDEKFIFMQYTGFKDKNGKEIYEGDIVQWEAEMPGTKIEMNEVITWANYYGFIDSEEMDTMVIIGNIYENKDLIK